MPVDSLTLMAALLSGLLGGVHCAAMCGGIATGFSAMSPHGGLWQAVQVNLGRVSGYVLAGAIVGGFGGGLLRVFRMDLLVVGLPYRKRFGGEFAIGRTIPYILQNAPCTVWVVREPARRIVLRPWADRAAGLSRSALGSVRRLRAGR